MTREQILAAALEKIRDNPGGAGMWSLAQTAGAALESAAKVPGLADDHAVQAILGARGIWSAEIFGALQEIDAYQRDGK